MNVTPNCSVMADEFLGHRRGRLVSLAFVALLFSMVYTNAAVASKSEDGGKKIAFVNMKEVEKAPCVQKLLDRLKVPLSKCQDCLIKKRGKIEEDMAKLGQDNVASATITNAAKKLKAEAIQREVATYQKTSREAAAKMEAAQGSCLESIRSALSESASKVAKSEGYITVIDGATILYFDGLNVIDATPKIVAMLEKKNNFSKIDVSSLLDPVAVCYCPRSNG